MADTETTAGIAAAISALITALKELVMWIVRAIRGNTKAQLAGAKAEDDARTEERERELANKAESRILRAIDDLGAKVDRQGQTVIDMRENLAAINQRLSDGDRRIERISDKVFRKSGD